MLHGRLQRVHVALFSIALCLGHASRALGADPTTADCLVSNDRSIALRNQHQLRAARAELLVCAAPTCPGDIRTECVRRVAEVNAQMPTIVFEVRDSEGNDLPAVSVVMDGQPLVERIEGTALSIDPGEHEFVFTAANLAPVRKNWVIREGEKGRRERVSLGADSPQPEGPSEAPALAAASSAPQPPPAKPSGGLSMQRVVGIAVGGLGVVGLGIALYEQLTASSRYSSSKDAADNPALPVRKTAHPLYQQAKRAQNYAIMFGAIGAVAVGAGLVLVFAGSDESEPHDEAITHQSIMPAIGPGGGGIVYSTTF
jgi:hypothetical protein